MNVRRSLPLGLLCAAALVAGCGGGGVDGVVPVTVSSPPPVSPPSATAPVIDTQPAAQTVAAGGSATFTVVASNGPLVYQWLSAPTLGAVFTEIPGATGASYTVGSAGAAENGRYYSVIVTNSYGSVAGDPAKLTVTGLTGGGGGGGGTAAASSACAPWSQPAGTEVRTTYANAVPPSTGDTVTTVVGATSFEGHAVTEVRVQTPLLTATLDAHLYASVDAGTGAVTAYGSDSTSSVGTTSTSTHSVYVTPSVLTELSLAPGATAPAHSVTLIDTTVANIDGVVQPATTATHTTTVAATTFDGFESVTVPAGTFTACRYTSGGNTQWLLKGYGTPVKDSAGGQAMVIRLNGAVITGN